MRKPLNNNDLVLNLSALTFLEFRKSDIFLDTAVSSFINQNMLFVCFITAEFLALCPSGTGITGDGRGDTHRLIHMCFAGFKTPTVKQSSCFYRVFPSHVQQAILCLLRY